MRSIIVTTIIAALLLTACKGWVDDDSPSFVQRDVNDRVQNPDKAPPQPTRLLISAGEFGYNTYRIAGTAAYVIEEETTLLIFQRFQAEARPNLHVVVANAAGTEVDLGALPAYTGNVSIVLPQSVSPSSYTKVHIKSGSTILATAELS